MVRIGVVGSGFMAETHLEAYDGIDDAEVVAVTSPNTAASFVETHVPGADSFSSVEAMLDDADLDAIDICSPTPTHRPVVEAAAERSIAVFCEKPIAGSLGDADAIAATVSDADITFMVGHVLRFFPQYEAIKETVEGGGIGSPGVGRARRLSPYPEWGHGNWYAEDSGGVLLDLVIHDFDFLRWTFGEVERVFARRTRWEGAEHAHATLRFENGSVGYVEGSWALPPDEELQSSIELAGDEGLIELGSNDPALRISRAGESTAESPIAADGYRRELAEFVDCVQTGETPSVGAAEATEALRISLAAIQSASRGAPVSLSEVGQ
ncbi:Gfo/Idh/MocA family protein [Haloarchaeobius sp. TZWSO28]|uniref:Gfo/Idh/MocA family protein n=1 Tax=Haloarchaeobius sp. TZWSO28 TaxID=3446119 RepID=UPI003EBBAC52